MTRNFADQGRQISYVIMRLAIYIRRPEFRVRLEAGALDLVEALAAQDFEKALMRLGAMGELVKLGQALYEIESANAGIIIEALQNLEAALRQKYGLNDLPDLNQLLGNSGNAAMEQNNENTPLPNMRQDETPNNASLLDAANSALQGIATPAPAINNVDEPNVGEGNESATISLPVSGRMTAEEDKDEGGASGGMISVGAAIRQSAILDKIQIIATRENGMGGLHGCRMKDLMQMFPNVSERTLRYDLQHLLSQGRIQRVGNGGPASFYVMK